MADANSPLPPNNESFLPQSTVLIVDDNPQNVELLLAFLESPQRVLTREQLLDLARNRVVAPGFDRSIDVQISRLRRKMGAQDAEGIFKTIRGSGYMFIPTVTRL